MSRASSERPSLEGVNGTDSMLAEVSVQHDRAGADGPKVPGREFLREVVIQIETQKAATRIGRFQVMPFVFRHEELAAVTRVVVAMRSHDPFFFTEPSVRTRSGIGVEPLGLLAAVPEMIDDDGDEIAFVDGARSRLVVDPKLRVDGAGHGRFDANRLQGHLADRTDARLVLDDVRIHRADV